MAAATGSKVIDVREAPWIRWRLASGKAPPVPPLIDVHHHVIPPPVKVRTVACGYRRRRGWSISRWTSSSVAVTSPRGHTRTCTLLDVGRRQYWRDLRYCELHVLPAYEEHITWRSTVGGDLRKRWSAQR